MYCAFVDYHTEVYIRYFDTESKAIDFVNYIIAEEGLPFDSGVYYINK